MKKTNILCALTGIAMMLVLLNGCDANKFFSYNYDAAEISEVIDIRGQLINVFTDMPVKDATVSFGGQATLSDSSGGYLLKYFLGLDEQYNQDIPVHITHPKYETLDTSMVIFPSGNVLNARLVYAAPIILAGHIENDTTCPDPENIFSCTVTASAVVFDYQGESDIDSVFIEGRYLDDGNHKVVTQSTQIYYTGAIDGQTARFEGQIPFYIPTVGGSGESIGVLINNLFFVRAVDKSGFRESFFVNGLGK